MEARPQLTQSLADSVLNTLTKARVVVAAGATSIMQRNPR